MNKQKSFIAISSIIHNNKLVYLCSSKGDSIFNEQGINFDAALDFLFSLIKYRRKSGVTFVCFNQAVSNEILFSTMSKGLRDKLFQSHLIKPYADSLELELEQVEDVFYNADTNSQKREQADFSRYVLRHAIQDLLEVKYNDYKITLRNGKMLTINKNSKSLSIYDVYGFFKKQSLRQAYALFGDTDISNLDRNIFTSNPFYNKETEIDQLKIFAQLEAEYISKLTLELDSALQKEDINLRRYYGASCIISHFLNKWQAKKNYHNYRYRRQLSPVLFSAVNNAFYGGRIEQFKLGTCKDVKIYDINSAYGFASTKLPVMLKKPSYQREYNKDASFSLWYVDFDFTGMYFGLLPVRTRGNQVKFPLRGSGWYWNNEISFIMENYPQMIKIKHGYVLNENRTVSFAEDLEKLYDLRLRLKQDNSPLEKTIKETLSNINGRFAQSVSKQPYYNLFYAGFVTSQTRRQLLEATKGYEKETICFQTDAIHTTAILPANVNDEMGNYKLSEYKSITYIDNGVYQDNLKQKIKTRGLKALDFNNALCEMQSDYTYEAQANVFIGHNLYTLNEFPKAKYLDIHNVSLKFNPSSEKRSRIFEKKKIDFLNDYLDSLPLKEISRQQTRKSDTHIFKYMTDALEVRV